MFELGKDLSRYIARGAGGEPRDPEVLELLAAPVLAEQARREARHADEREAAWRDVARLWREHARRTGEPASARLALQAAERAMQHAGRTRDKAMAVCGLVLLTRWDLFGEEMALREAGALGRRLAERGEGLLAARVAMRQAARIDDLTAQRRSVDGLHAELAKALAASGGDAWRRADLIEARLEYAAALGDLGIRAKSVELLDRAGREVRAVIAGTDEDRTPVSRARALATCGAALAVLGEMAGRGERIEEAVDMLEAASGAFTPDHSPMDAAVILAAQAAALHRLAGQGRGEVLATAGSLALKARRLAPAGTRLNAQIEVTANRLRIAQAVATGANRALRSMEANLRQALAAAGSQADPAAWGVDQLALAGVYDGLAALGEGPDRREDAALARSLALETLREAGVAA